MYTAMGGTPWQANGGFSQPSAQAAYIPVSTRNPYASHLPPPPTYVPTPLGSASAYTPPPPPPPPPPVAQSPASADQPRKKIDWPPSVREYVNRCFASENQIRGIERPDMEKKLKDVVTYAAETNNLHTWDWAAIPLPQQILQDERNRAVLGVPNTSAASFLPPPPPPFVPFPNGFQVPPPAGHDGLRKRKSSELSMNEPNTAAAPWHAQKSKSLTDRITPADKRPKMDHNTSKSHLNLEQRKRRFENDRSGSNSPRKLTAGGLSPVPAETVGPVVGRSQKLEKNYFRLTSAPNPDDVRPLSVLKQTLELLKKKWRKDANYGYICDQFKSLRQDLTVQHIKDEFTTTVYEHHARIALEKGDLGEYNQCQTQLRALYRSGLGGHPREFQAYRILYYLYTCNRTDMNDVLSDLTPTDKSSEEIKHALAVRSALALGNYHQFFKLYMNPPNMGAYLMDMFIERERLKALAIMSRVYKPTIRLRFITEELGFENEAEAAQFIVDHDGKELLKEKDDHVEVLMGNRLFEDAKNAAFSQVDIKGQI